jgi:hypothetical protein
MPASALTMPCLLLVGVGFVVSCRRDPRRSTALAAFGAAALVLPVLGLEMKSHWVSVRYVLCALPALVLFLSCGAEAVVRLATFPLRRWSIAAEVGAVCAVAAITLGAAAIHADGVKTALADKADWRAVARLIRDRARPGDRVVTSNSWAALCLGYYLPRMALPLDVRSAEESVARAQELAKEGGHAFLVTGGFHRSSDVRRWMDGFYLLYSSPVETIRVFYYPDRAAYLAAKLIPAVRQDEEVFWGRLGGELHFDRSCDEFLLDGWGEPEQIQKGDTARWGLGPVSRVYVPVSGNTPPVGVRVVLAPHDALAGRLRMRVGLNGTGIREFRLKAGANAVDIETSQAPWRLGGNILSLEFSETVRPAQLGGSDNRPLTARFVLIKFLK